MRTPTSEPWELEKGLRGYRWRAPANGAVLLLQHGYAEYAERYLDRYGRLIPHLVASGFNVHAFDMRGHGRSPGARGATDVERTVRDHQAARALLREDGRPLFLFGHSLGGLVTAASVARDQNHVAGVVLSSPALLLGARPAVRWIAGMLRRVAPTLGLGAAQPAAGLSRDAGEVQLFDADPLVFRGRMPARLGASALAVADASWPLYRDWNVPTLILHGTDDTYTDPRGSVLFDALVSAPVHELMMVQGGRHELLNDLDRVAVLNKTLSWLRARAMDQLGAEAAVR